MVATMPKHNDLITANISAAILFQNKDENVITANCWNVDIVYSAVFNKHLILVTKQRLMAFVLAMCW